MDIRVWLPGESRYSKVDVSVGDDVQVKLWDGCIINGTVVSVSCDTIGLMDALLVEEVFVKSTDNLNKYTRLNESGETVAIEKISIDLDDVYGIDVIESLEEHAIFEEIAYFSEEVFDKFLKVLNEKLNNPRQPITLEYYNKILERYAKDNGYKTLVNNLIQKELNMSFPELLSHCCSKVA